MLKLYHAPLTRSVRIVFLLEELGLPYELETVPFVPPTTPFTQQTPAGKFPVLQDDGVTIFESGAILEYVIERYGKGRLAPAPGTPERGAYFQWIHFSEATAFPPLGEIAFNTLFKPEHERVPSVVEDGRRRAGAALAVLEKAIAGKDYLLGRELSGADIMMAYTLLVARMLGVLTDAYPNLNAYFARLEARPGFQKAVQ
jgi:glutathione S-transferase